MSRHAGSLPDRLRKLTVGSVETLSERLEPACIGQAEIRASLNRLRNIANSAIHRATGDGRSYRRESLVVTIPETHDIVPQIIIQRTA